MGGIAPEAMCPTLDLTEPGGRPLGQFDVLLRSKWSIDSGDLFWDL